MRVLPSLIVFALCVLLPGINFADSLDERVAKIREQLDQEISKLESNVREEESAQRQQRLIAVELRRMKSLLSGTRGEDPQIVISALNSSPNLPVEIRATAEELAKDLPELTRVYTEEQLTRMNAVLERVVPACLAAKAEADLNPILRELGEIRLNEQGISDPRLERASRKVQSAIQTVSRWQDYLAQQAVGNPEAAAGALKLLLQNRDYAIMPRDEITARLPPSEPDRRQEEGLKLLASVQSLDQLAPVIDKLHASRAASQNPNAFPAIPEVERLASAHVALQNGLLGEAFSTATTSSNFPPPARDNPSWYPEILRLRGLLLRAVVPRILELEETPELKPEEDVATYLIRVVDKCVAEKRYAEASRVLGTYRSVAFGRTGPNPEWLAPDIEGLRTLAVGEQLANAGSIFEAIKTLKKAVTTVGRFTPVSSIQARLKELEAQYPEQAKAAAKSAETDQQYDELKSKLLSEMQRSLEARMPPDIRARMRPQP